MNPFTKERTLLSRAITANMLLAVFSGIVVTSLYVAAQRSEFDHQLRLRADTLAEFLATQSQLGMLVENRADLQQIASNALSVEYVLFVEMLDRSGRRVARASRADITERSIPDVREGLGGAQYPVESVISLEGHGRMLDFRRSIHAPSSGGLLEWESRPASPAQLGTVRLGLSMARQTHLMNQAIRYGVMVIAIYLLATLVVQFLLLRRLLQPLAGLIEFTRQIGKGELQRRAPVARHDEIGRLAVAFNQMVDQLGSTTVSRNYVNNILQSMAESMIVVDGERRIRMVNPAAATLLGFTEDELLGQPASLVIGPGHTDSNDAETPARGVERSYRTRNGSLIPVLFSAAALPEDSGMSGQVWLAQDISERKRAEQELRLAQTTAEKASRAKSEMLSRTSHELRTPLNAILGFAQLLELSELSEDDTGNVNQILKAGRHLLRLINEVLEIAGVESGRRTLSIEPVGVAGVASETLDLIRPLASGRAIKMFYDTARFDGYQVLADRYRLQQVLLNLLSNAVKYNRHGGRIVVDCEERPGQMLRVRIHDTGLGIAPEGIARLFVPFERLGAEQRDIEGTGLGLMFARSFAEAMGGSVGVSSVPGEGSTFWIDLRLTEAAPAAVPADLEEPPEACPDHSARRVLYVEDNISNRELIEGAFRRRPAFDLIAVSRGEEGIAAARQHQPDLILLDLHLPDFWGDEVLRRLQSDPVTAAIPVIMLSADATPNQIQRLMSLGAKDYLTKPIDIRNLLRVVDERLKEPQNDLQLIAN
jgi:PAS domain S-box-containing protein